jgi:hypothetical protein
MIGLARDIDAFFLEHGRCGDLDRMAVRPGKELVRDNAPELRLMHQWLDASAGIGLIIVGMEWQGYDLQLTAYGGRGWRATFFAVGIAHSIVGCTGWERTPWRVVQRWRWHWLRSPCAGAGLVTAWSGGRGRGPRPSRGCRVFGVSRNPAIGGKPFQPH